MQQSTKALTYYQVWKCSLQRHTSKSSSFSDALMKVSVSLLDNSHCWHNPTCDWIRFLSVTEVFVDSWLLSCQKSYIAWRVSIDVSKCPPFDNFLQKLIWSKMPSCFRERERVLADLPYHLWTNWSPLLFL